MTRFLHIAISPLLLLLLLIGTDQRTHAQVFYDQDFRDRASDGLERTYNFEFAKAQEIYANLRDDYPKHPGPHFLLALNLWWKSYITASTQWHAEIFAELDTSLTLNKAFKNRMDAELEYVFFEYMSYAFIARLHVLRGEWWSGANAGRKALPNLKKGFKFTKQSPEFYFSSGIYHYYAEVYPEEHPIVKPFTIFFPNGDADLGLEELESAAATPNFTQIEAKFYLTDLYLYWEKDPQKAVANQAQLVRAFPGNTQFRMEYGRALVYLKDWEQAESVLLPMKRAFEGIPNHRTRQITPDISPTTSLLMIRTYHLLGQCELEKGNLNVARSYFEESLHLSTLAQQPNDTWPASAAYNLGRIHDLQGHRAQALECYEKALAMEPDEHIKQRIKDCQKSPCVD
ncbi:tetratricopeptide repeat protein [Pontibacter sp. G13]|uniref:tetratricopeptide repeat protein n=1 Tax=Pontibacter sp. G13 TaxID=3074898 RepID=UPI00288B6D89|nr:tetratricopeptide repeat protein [Pontibacter sp. G13]WNJ17582.1 tetratricopeptide repeat protein [Pontibacter sp. G13]